MGRGVTRGAQFPGREMTVGPPNHCVGDELRREAPKSPRASQSWSKIKKHSHFVTSSQENPKPKSKHFV